MLVAQGTQVRGYEGRFLMEGEKIFLHVAYEAGLGERNSQGFGMFRVLSGGAYGANLRMSSPKRLPIAP